MTASVFHAHLYGTRESKYQRLAESDVGTTPWTELQPSAPHYLFVAQDTNLRAEYEQAWSITEILPLHGWGVATRKDYLLVDFDRSKLIGRFDDIRRLPSNVAKVKYGIKDSPHWDFEAAQKQISSSVADKVRPILFRPFDSRFVFYERFMIERGDHRFDLMRHMFGSNLSLISVRRTEVSGTPNHFFCSDQMSVLHSTSAKEGNFVFPLYLYPASGELDASGTRCPNLSPAFLKALAEKLKLPQEEPYGLPQGVAPEDVFHYAYAVFHSPTYRTRYAEFLKIDFPRLPLTSDVNLFRALAAKGAELVALHLLESPALEEFLTDWPVKGDNVVEKVQYTEKENRVWINKAQYFGGVPKAVWEFHIGGYQVCHKWLKDRKGRRLTYEDTQHYQKIVVALSETIRLMAEIDEVIGQQGGWPIK